MTPRALIRLANIAEYAAMFGIPFHRSYYIAMSPNNYRIMRRQIGAAS